MAFGPRLLGHRDTGSGYWLFHTSELFLFTGFLTPSGWVFSSHLPIYNSPIVGCPTIQQNSDTTERQRQIPQVTDSVPQDCPHFRFHIVTSVSDDQQDSRNPLVKFSYLLEWLTELWNALYLHLLFYCKGYDSGTVKWKQFLGQGVGGRVQRAS